MTSSSNLECAEAEPSHSPPLPQTESTVTKRPSEVNPVSENIDESIDEQTSQNPPSEVNETTPIAEDVNEVTTVTEDNSQEVNDESINEIEKTLEDNLHQQNDEVINEVIDETAQKLAESLNRGQSEPLPLTESSLNGEVLLQKASSQKPENQKNERTAELIQKQMNEIEKEINRRMQNKNIRQVSGEVKEAEDNTLLLTLSFLLLLLDRRGRVGPTSQRPRLRQFCRCQHVQ